MRPWISTLLESPVRTVISPEPVWTSRSTAPDTVSVRSKWPSSLASAGLAAIVAATANTSASSTGKVRVRIFIVHPPEQIGPNSDEDTQTSPEKFQSTSGGCLGRLAVALFVLLAGAARAGIVAADFGAGADGLGRFDWRVASLKLHLLFLATLLAFDFFRRKLRESARDQRFLRGRCRLRRRRGRLFRRAHQKEEPHGFSVDAIHQLIEKYECFLLELDQRIFLPVPAQADAFLQMVQREEMVFPLAVHHIQQNVALQPAQCLRAEKRFFLLVARAHFFDERLAHGFMIQRREIHPHGFGIEAELVQNFIGELRDVPLVRMLFARAMGLDQLVGDGVGALQYEFFLIAAFQERAAQIVNRFALLVHHVVIF